jgi:hypothetical protein
MHPTPQTNWSTVLNTSEGRAQLGVAGKPYYCVLQTGLHLGYRKNKTGGRWVMRSYVGFGRYNVETLAKADDVDAHGGNVLNYTQAEALIRMLYSERLWIVRGLTVG